MDTVMSQASSDIHLLIIGAGPAGIAAAVQAGQRGLSATLIERGRVAETIARYQKGKLVMDEPKRLPLHEELDMPFHESRREEILEDWQAAVERSGVRLLHGPEYEMTQLEGARGAYRCALRGGQVLEATHILLSIGVQGNLRSFGVPGDEQPWVTYQLDDPAEHQGERVVIVGVGDSGIENALALSESGNAVTVVNRRAEFDRAKVANRTKIEAAIASGEIELCINSSVERFDSDAVILKGADGERRISADLVIGRLGAIPPRRFLKDLGVGFSSDDPTGVPLVGPNYESQRSGLFLIGAVVGYPLIKNCMNQGFEVVEHILGNEVLPADEPVLAEKFAPLKATPSQVVTYLRATTPAMAELSDIQIRELLFDANVRRFSAGEMIYDRGDFSNTVFVLLTGGAEMERSPDELARQAGARATKIDPVALSPARLSRGQLFGIGSLISGRRREHTTRAIEDSIVVEIARGVMTRLLNSNEKIRDALIESFVRELSLTQLLKPDERNRLVAQIELRTYNAGDILYDQAAPPDGIYFLMKGSVSISLNDNGQFRILDYAQAGRWLGGRGALSPESPRLFRLTSMGLTEAVFIPLSALEGLPERYPQIKTVLGESAAAAVANAARRNMPGVQDPLTELVGTTGLHEATDLLVIDESICIRCDNCEKACSATHEGVSRLDRESGPTFPTRDGPQIHLPTACQHCENPKCMTDCPPDALRRDPNGEVYIQDNCIGCGNCASNCPYDVIKMVELQPSEPPNLLMRLLSHRWFGGTQEEEAELHKVAAKCDLCMNLSRPWGGEPKAACVASCPTGAISRVDPRVFIDGTG
jgi:Fe-S-cluster-containing hydrogenase component 2/thioredoxin reductase/CRP-like cAMP-binding protein